MRIVAGIYGGRKLSVPAGRDIRPTSDKIRGAVMNMLRSRGAIENAHVIDAFCGTGALGLEAMSQGAASCVFIDSSWDSLNLAQDNAKALGVAAQFLLKDATKIGQKPQQTEPASLLFLDPPYNKDLILPSLESLQQNGWVKKGTWIVVEAEEKFTAAWPDFIAQDAEKSYGETKIILLKMQ